MQAALDDARLSDAVPVLDGFEHALVVPSDSGVLDCAPGLARALDRLARFPGPVLLVAHIEDVRGVRLAPQLTRRLRFSMPIGAPDAKLRAAVWRRALPSSVPLDADVDLNVLGRRHELLPASIGRAVSAPRGRGARRQRRAWRAAAARRCRGRCGISTRRRRANRCEAAKAPFQDLALDADARCGSACCSYARRHLSQAPVPGARNPQERLYAARVESPHALEAHVTSSSMIDVRPRPRVRLRRGARAAETTIGVACRRARRKPRRLRGRLR